MAETYSVITSLETKLFALRTLAYQLFIAGKIVLFKYVWWGSIDIESTKKDKW
jgi:hypothetical protein